MDTLAQPHYAIDTLYLLLAGLLVAWLQIGMACFQAGMIRAKNVLDIFAKNIVLQALVGVAYLMLGYSLMFGGDPMLHPYVPSLVGGENVVQLLLHSDQPHHHLASVFFQLMVAGVVIAIVIGATAERIKPGVLSILAIIIAGIIYPVAGYWSWGEGFLAQLGFIDVAGSGVVHLAGGAAALAILLLLGPRVDKYSAGKKPNVLKPSNLALVGLGGLLTWLGSFGLNSGAQATFATVELANAIANNLINTHAAFVAGLLATLIASRLLYGKADLTFALNGGIAGLVAIAASPVTPNIILAMGIGLVAGLSALVAMILLERLGLDDPIGAVSVHGVAGAWGLLAATFSQNYQTLATLHNQPWTFGQQWLVQWAGIWAIATFVFVATLIVVWVIKWIVTIRVSKAEEYRGLDLVEYGIQAYPEFVKPTPQ